MSLPDPFTANHALIERAISHVCGRQRLSGAERDDFTGAARLALIENDYARLRAFAGRSSLQTYLIVILTRLFQDWRNARWGKWRPSAEAQRLGPVAVRLETLVVRDKLSFDEACETLRINHGVTESRAALERLYARFPVRAGRTFTDDESLEQMAAPDGATDADARLLAAEAGATAARAGQALDAGVRALPPQDRLVLKMRFQDEFSVADIAKALKLEQKPLYRRIERLLLELRKSLEGAGFDAAAIRTVIADRGFDAVNWESRGEVRLFDRGRSPVGVEKVS